jgi:hypothetical protein
LVREYPPSSWPKTELKTEPKTEPKSEEKLKGALALNPQDPCLGQRFDQNGPLWSSLPFSYQSAWLCMYLLTIRDGLQTRYVGPYQSPKHAADDLERLLPLCAERARWQIYALEAPGHALEAPDQVLRSLVGPGIKAAA